MARTHDVSPGQCVASQESTVPRKYQEKDRVALFSLLAISQSMSLAIADWLIISMFFFLRLALTIRTLFERTHF